MSMTVRGLTAGRYCRLLRPLSNTSASSTAARKSSMVAASKRAKASKYMEAAMAEKKETCDCCRAAISDGLDRDKSTAPREAAVSVAAFRTRPLRTDREARAMPLPRQRSNAFLHAWPLMPPTMRKLVRIRACAGSGGWMVRWRGAGCLRARTRRAGEESRSRKEARKRGATCRGPGQFLRRLNARVWFRCACTQQTISLAPSSIVSDILKLARVFADLCLLRIPAC